MTELKNIIITGASSGLGLEVVKKIAKNCKEFRIILACRNLKKANPIKDTIIKETNNQNLIVMELDTSSLDSVKNFTENYKKSPYGKIDVLACNAGIGGSGPERTKDDFDLIFETNHLGHFLLVKLLLPLMKENGRIFVTSSDMHDPPKMFCPTYEWVGSEKLAKPDPEFAKNPIRYCYSKLCNLYFIYELIKRLKNQKLYINAFNPGYMPNTGLQKVTEEEVKMMRDNFPDRMGDLEKSSQALYELLTKKDLNQTGKFYDRSTNIKETSELSYNEKNAKELWDLSESYVKKYL